MTERAILALEDGTVFQGTSIGAPVTTVGEVVFNTAMTGYQEILTDPSYARQLVTLTYPHIGNTGCNPVDEEAANPFAAALIVRDVPVRASNWRQQTTLGQYLADRGVPGIADIDTRKLTRLLRSNGAQSGCLMAGPDAAADAATETALAKAREFPGLQGMDLAKVVSSQSIYDWSEGSYDLDQQVSSQGQDKAAHRVVAYDFGIKRNILRMLVDRGCAITVVPAQTPAAEVLAMNPDGVFLSNGPGDPEPCDYAIDAIKQIVDSGKPVFGICLGHQLLALASGARTEKMKFGHHGANHPVQVTHAQQDGRRPVYITSQNHGFAVAEDSLPDTLVATHRSLFDDSLQGVRRTDAPAFGFQGHPEASPGPHDIAPVFDQFITMMEQAGQ